MKHWKVEGGVGGKRGTSGLWGRRRCPRARLVVPDPTMGGSGVVVYRWTLDSHLRPLH